MNQLPPALARELAQVVHQLERRPVAKRSSGSRGGGKNRKSGRRVVGKKLQIPLGILSWVLQEMTRAVLSPDRRLDPGPGPDHHNARRRAVALLTKDGRVVYGVERFHPNSPCSLNAIDAAIGIGCSAGYHEFVAAIQYEPGGTADTMLGSDETCGLYQYSSRIANNMFIVCANEVAGKPKVILQTHLRELKKHWQPRTTTKCAPKPMEIIWKLPDSLALVLPEKTRAFIRGEPDHEFWKAVSEFVVPKMRSLLANCTADGVHSPARRRHAAVVISTDGYIFGGVNIRKEDRKGVFCAENVAVMTANTAGYMELVVGMVIGKDCGEETPQTCGICGEVYSGYTVPSFDHDMVLGHFTTTHSNGSVYIEHAFTTLQRSFPRPYAAVDRNSRGQNGDHSH